jgi:hypothetical protein
MGNCSSCGSPIPDGQRVCSMYYGDPYYGRDGYYLSWLESQQQAEIERQRKEQQMMAEGQGGADSEKNDVDDLELPF